MKLLCIIIVLSSVTRHGELQTATRLRNSPDRIYFTDINGRIQANERVTSEKTDVDVQKSVEVKSHVDQNYLQNIPTPRYPTTVKENGPQPELPRVYLQLQPALFLNDPNYYGDRLTEDIQAFRPTGRVPLQSYAPAQAQLPQAELNPQPQMGQSQVFNQQVQPIRPPVNQNINTQQNFKVSDQKKYDSELNIQKPLPGQTTLTVESNAPVSRAVANFGLNLLRNAPSSSNVVFSPFSIVTLLSLLQQGALGQTQQQISAALQMTPDYSAGAFKTFLDDIQKRTSRNLLRLANNVFVADAFDLNKEFKSVAIRQFGSEVTPTKFYRSDAVDKINLWVATKTNNKIEKLLSQDAVGENTQLLLVNVVYFKGLWASKFRPEATLPSEFKYSDGSVRSVPFMNTRRAFKTGYDSELGSQVLILPFESDLYSLMIILPSTVSNVDALISTMTDERLIRYNTFNAKDVIVKLPKFTVRADIDLTPIFKKMGITNIFSQQAELSGLGMYRTNSPQVSAAVHSAMLSIDEEGGTATAATAIAAVALSFDHDSIINFNADRPFLAVLWDNQAILPLFMAKVENPTA